MRNLALARARGGLVGGVLGVLAVLASACASSSAPPPTQPISPAAPALDPSSTGPLTEAEFKALHELPTAGPAERLGETIDLGGRRAYLSLPAGTGPFPAIVVIHEWWGLNANIEHWADRLASAGWAAIAVDLYGEVATTREEAMRLVKSVDDARAAATIDAALQFAATDPRIQATTRAVIGWCFGGGWALKTALTQPALDGAIVYYGQLETDPTRLAAIKARVLGVFANQDKGIPPAAVDAFEAGLKQAGVDATIHRYDAEHAFANPSNPSYDQAAASDAWAKVLAFLGTLRD